MRQQQDDLACHEELSWMVEERNDALRCNRSSLISSSSSTDETSLFDDLTLSSSGTTCLSPESLTDLNLSCEEDLLECLDDKTDHSPLSGCNQAEDDDEEEEDDEELVAIHQAGCRDLNSNALSFNVQSTGSSAFKAVGQHLHLPPVGSSSSRPGSSSSQQWRSSSISPPSPPTMGRSRSVSDARVLAVSRIPSSSSFAPVRSCSVPPMLHPSAPPRLSRSASLGSLPRSRSVNNLSAMYRDSTGRFYSKQNLQKLDERGRADLGEVVANMHSLDRRHYVASRHYLQLLQTDTTLQQWRRGAVLWFTKVVEMLKINREVVWTSLNFLDRFLSIVRIRALCNFEHVVCCAFVMGCKIHHTSIPIPSSHLAQLCSVHVETAALCELELQIIKALRWHLNPPTPGSIIHHLINFLPCGSNSDDLPVAADLLLKLDEEANDLALAALESPEVLLFPVSVLAIASMLQAIKHVLPQPQAMSQHWIQALRRYGVPVDEAAVSGCMELLRSIAGDDDVDEEEVEDPLMADVWGVDEDDEMDVDEEEEEAWSTGFEDVSPRGAAAGLQYQQQHQACLLPPPSPQSWRELRLRDFMEPSPVVGLQQAASTKWFPTVVSDAGGSGNDNNRTSGGRCFVPITMCDRPPSAGASSSSGVPLLPVLPAQQQQHKAAGAAATLVPAALRPAQCFGRHEPQAVLLPGVGQHVKAL